jgi:non-ribosomal peptide synthetase component F
MDELSVKAGAIMQNFVRPFDLSRAPLLRVGVIETGIAQPVLQIDLHHIVTDGTSQQVLEREFFSLFNGEELPILRLHYKDFAQWQNHRAQQEKLRRQEEYWLNLLCDELPVLDLPGDYPRPPVQSFSGASVGFVLSEQETESIKAIENRTGATLFMVILAMYNVLLSKLSGLEEIIVGTPTAGRRHADLENIIGMFVNTIAMKNNPHREKRFMEFLAEVKQDILSAYENQDYQFEELVEKLDVKRDAGRNPVFDVMLNVLNLTDYRGEFSPEEISSGYRHVRGEAKFDLTLSVADYGKNLYFNLSYCTDLFKPETIERYIEYFKSIVEQITLDAEQKLSQIEIITDAEKREILNDFNKLDTEYAADRTMHELFEQQAAKNPHNTALTFEDKYLSYGQLDERANRLANILAEKGVTAGSITGLMVERSLEMIIAILAVLKTGGAYLPINPRNPLVRTRFMLDDSKASLLVTTRSLGKEVENLRVEMLMVDDVMQPETDRRGLIHQTQRSVPSNLASGGPQF